MLKGSSQWRLDITTGKNNPRKDTEYFNNFLTALRYAQKMAWKETVLECHIIREV